MRLVPGISYIIAIFLSPASLLLFLSTPFRQCEINMLRALSRMKSHFVFQNQVLPRPFKKVELDGMTDGSWATEISNWPLHASTSVFSLSFSAVLFPMPLALHSGGSGERLAGFISKVMVDLYVCSSAPPPQSIFHGALKFRRTIREQVYTLAAPLPVAFPAWGRFISVTEMSVAMSFPCSVRVYWWDRVSLSSLEQASWECLKLWTWVCVNVCGCVSKRKNWNVNQVLYIYIYI